MKTEADDDDGAVSVDFFFPVKSCLIPAGSVRLFPGITEKKIMESIAGIEIATNTDTDNTVITNFTF
jgi:hypothetical protein